MGNKISYSYKIFKSIEIQTRNQKRTLPLFVKCNPKPNVGSENIESLCIYIALNKSEIVLFSKSLFFSLL